MSTTTHRPASLARLFLFGALIVLVIAIAAHLGGHTLTLEALQQHAASLRRTIATHPIISAAVYFALYIAATALSVPGAIILTIGAGALFGVIEGSILVSFASSIGASLAFLTARFLLRDMALGRFPGLFARIDQGIARDGALYLISLRLAPVVPFVAVNLLAGLTKLSLRRFYLASQIGMLPATLIYVNAGAGLATLGRHGAILTPRLIIGLLLLAALPMIAPRLRDLFIARRAYAGFTRPKHFDRNLIVIGAGAAGLVSAYVASAVRAKVTLIEAARMGGDCLNTGCVPSKALLHAARHGADFSAARAAVHAAITGIAPHDSVARYQSLGVDVRIGHAMIETPWSVTINGETLTTRAIVIAAGAEPFVPALPGLADSPFATSETLWDIEALPARLVILGGGPIGCEMAQAFARLGSHVTLVEMADRLMLREDDAVSAAMVTRLTRDGVTIRTAHRAIAVQHDADGYSLRAEHDGAATIIPFDRLLVAIGRKPRVTGYGLEALGVKLAKSGIIETGETLQTSFPNIFACGDVSGPYQLTHVAGFQGGFAALNALFAPLWRFKPSYRAVPAVTYTSPEIARVGLNEREAKAQNLAYELTHYDFAELDRAIAEGDTEGFITVLTRKGSDQILGATIVGTQAGELLSSFTLAMQNKLGLKKLMSAIYPYPTRSEAIRAIAGQWRQNHTSPRSLAILERFHRWRRG
ncbi:MAG: pyridine nucleotide-disulfide oxidoreductase [Acidiphilium sp. 21-60-14]|nr:MAG: pyridine nucleotide-disulfide oxidoreductase [Acidiphilium sp. 21-60-14]OYV90328.1 MAG: pyridine nucleotide-disulfide oxidoreductase [Acidiphilium sp. 37-60-79]OZB41554.1 MAG: pyridine nucleotide-disulfide oxidoreductase [Acidiphilium sp. 34-60-192]HQU24006.1 FAD-dependent oxidoreductase [Acidiphilium sp.]